MRHWICCANFLGGRLQTPTTESIWIRIECLPLPYSDWSPRILFWNPVTETLQGDGVEEILQLLEDAVAKGYVCGSTFSHFEILHPLQKPSELAAVLGQHYWLIPEPVESPEQCHPVTLQ